MTPLQVIISNNQTQSISVAALTRAGSRGLVTLRSEVSEPWLGTRLSIKTLADLVHLGMYPCRLRAGEGLTVCGKEAVPKMLLKAARKAIAGP